MLPLHITWKDPTGAHVYRGGDFSDSSWREEELQAGVLQPGSASDLLPVVLQNPVEERRFEMLSQGVTDLGTAETFEHVRFYLEADDATLDQLLRLWPAQDAGVEMSFDEGVTWTRFSLTSGNPSDPATWIPMPGRSVSSDATDGELAAFPPLNRSNIKIRVKTPASPAKYGLFQFSIVPDWDVL